MVGENSAATFLNELRRNLVDSNFVFSKKFEFRVFDFLLVSAPQLGEIQICNFNAAVRLNPHKKTYLQIAHHLGKYAGKYAEILQSTFGKTI